jgi:hypothetical protein
VVAPNAQKHLTQEAAKNGTYCDWNCFCPEHHLLYLGKRAITRKPAEPAEDAHASLKIGKAS